MMMSVMIGSALTAALGDANKDDDNNNDGHDDDNDDVGKRMAAHPGFEVAPPKQCTNTA